MQRVDESRMMLIKAFYFSLGAYTEQESKKVDIWRDQSFGELFNHIKHELQEVQGDLKDNNLMTLIHNLSDIVGLGCIFLAKALEYNEKKADENKLKEKELIE